MILADKITKLRKESGWSQEEFADQLSVSRQAVSKWESGTSIPDLDKILKMSQLFGVSTDYLLKEEKEELEYSDSKEETLENEVSVSLELANAFMDIREAVSEKIALGVSLCIMSPIILILLGGMSEYNIIHISEDAAGGFGVAILLCIIAVAVAVFILHGSRLSKYEYLEKEKLCLQYGVQGIVEKKKEEFEDSFRVKITTGVIMCILGVVPLFVSIAFTENEFVYVICVCILLLLVALATYLFVTAGMVMDSFNVLLQKEEYSKENKAISQRIAAPYWSIITVIYLGWSFITMDWGFTWVIWPVAGVLYGAIIAIVRAIKH